MTSKVSSWATASVVGADDGVLVVAEVGEDALAPGGVGSSEPLQAANTHSAVRAAAILRGNLNLEPPARTSYGRLAIEYELYTYL